MDIYVNISEAPMEAENAAWLWFLPGFLPACYTTALGEAIVGWTKRDNARPHLPAEYLKRTINTALCDCKLVQNISSPRDTLASMHSSIEPTTLGLLS